MKKILRWLTIVWSLIGLLAWFGTRLDPRAFWIPSIFGPVYLWLLVGSVLLVLLLAYLREWRTALFPLVFLLISWTAIGNLFAWPDPPPPAATAAHPALTVLTTNMRQYRDATNGTVETAQFTKFFNLRPAQLMLLQEARYPSKYFLAALDSLSASGRGTYTYREKTLTLAVISDYPLRYVHREVGDNNYNGFLILDLLRPTDTIRLVNAHLRTNAITGMAEQVTTEGRLDEEDTWRTVKAIFGRYGRSAGLRAKQAAQIERLVKDSPYPVLLAGDFNDVPAGYVYRRLHRTFPVDAWLARGRGLGVTFNGSLPGLRIDYILADSSFRVHEVDKFDNGFSDHQTLWAEVSIGH